MNRSYFVGLIIFVMISSVMSDINFFYTAELHGTYYNKSNNTGVIHLNRFLKTQGGDYLLIDGGGFSGGGIYDFNTEGRVNDSIRTEIVVSLMGKASYDAVVIGDDELQYGSKWLIKMGKKHTVPFVSANVVDTLGSLIFPPYIITKKNNKKIAIVGLTSDSILVNCKREYHVKDPVLALYEIAEELKKKSDFQIIISHLGEENTEELMKHFPQFNFFFNSHRKKTDAPYFFENSSQILFNFPFQGDKVTKGVIRNPKIKLLGEAQWSTLTSNSDILRTVNKQYLNKFSKEKDRSKVKVLDIFLMSQCPYSKKFLESFLREKDNTPPFELRVHFIGDVISNGELRSLHGKSEVEENLLWLAMEDLHPQLYLDFLYLVNVNNVKPIDAISAMELDAKSINQWINHYGYKKLSQHFVKSTVLGINGSPTLLVNGVVDDKMLDTYYLFKNICEASSEKKSTFCRKLPRCHIDSDCKQRNMIGQCINEGNEKAICSFTKAKEFDFIVVVDQKGIVESERIPLVTTADLFPGAKITRIFADSEEGKRLIKNHRIKTLPYYLFHENVENTKNFFQIESGLEKQNGWYTFRDGIMKKRTYLERKYLRNEVTVYLNPFFKDHEAVLSSCFTKINKNVTIKVKPMFKKEYFVMFKDDYTLRQKILRWLEFSVQKNISFLQWKNFFLSKNQTIFDQSKIETKRQQTLDELFKNEELEQRGLDFVENVELLFENKELIPVRGRGELAELLEKINQRTDN